MAARFCYNATITTRFPDIVGGVIIGDVKNSATPSGLQSAYTTEQLETLARMAGISLSTVPSLAAWRSVFRAFDVDPTKYRSAAEALLRRLTKKGDIPNINTLVDIGNMVSIRYALPVAIFDAGDLVGDTLTVNFAEGTEPFIPLGAKDAEHPEAGEVIFTDDSRDVYARRWCWRQSAKSAAKPATYRVIVTVEGHHPNAHEDVSAALADLNTLLQRYANLDGKHGIIDANTLCFGG